MAGKGESLETWVLGVTGSQLCVRKAPQWQDTGREVGRQEARMVKMMQERTAGFQGDWTTGGVRCERGRSAGGGVETLQLGGQASPTGLQRNPLLLSHPKGPTRSPLGKGYNTIHLI